MSNDRNDEPFLTRWSRQKRDAAAPAVDTGTADVAADAPEVDLSKLPNIDDLTANSDITGFLRKGVPEALQRLALRRMWSLDPAIRDFVEIAENQWDFNAPGGIPGLYQDLLEGTDVSVWLAQAAPSAAATSSVAAQEKINSDGVNNIASQHIQKTADLKGSDGPDLAGDPATHESHADFTAGVVTQAPANIEDKAPCQELAAAAVPATRRRHGGALPQ